MIERHSFEFDRAIFNVIADADRRTLTLQFQHTTILERRSVGRILTAIRRRFGNGITSRLSRWKTGQASTLMLPGHGVSHPEYPDVLCFELKVKAGHEIELASPPSSISCVICRGISKHTARRSIATKCLRKCVNGRLVIRRQSQARY